MRNTYRLCLVLGHCLILASAATAAPLRISGLDAACGDAVDCDTTIELDSFEFAEEPGTGTVDADARIQTTTVHDDASGGSSSSRMAGRFEATAAGGSRWYRWVADFTAASDLTHALSIHVPSQTLTGRRVVAAWTENNSPTDFGCGVAVDSNRNLVLGYFGGSDGTCVLGTDAECDADELCFGGVTNGVCRKVWGTSGDVLRINACSTDPTIPCTAPGDCPGASPTCTLTYWGGVEVRQVNFSGSDVTCELWLNGLAIFAGTSKTIGGTPIQSLTNFAWGMTSAGDTPAGIVFIDDLVADNGADGRAGFGYVARKVPDGTSTQPGHSDWGTTGCGSTSTTKHECVRDYNVGTLFSYFTGVTTNDVIFTASSKKTQAFHRMTPAGASPALKPGESVTAVESLAVGRTGSGLPEFQQRILVCSNPDADDSCFSAIGPEVALTADTTVRLWHRFLATTAPVSGSSDWGQHLGELGQEFYSADSSSVTLRLGASLLYYRVRKPDAKSGITLRDHDQGADDGRVTIAYLGSSSLAGTLAVACSGSSTNAGEPCTYDSYCSWAAEIGKGHPIGGCLRLGGAALGACTANADCPSGQYCYESFCRSQATADLACRTCALRTDFACAVEGDCNLGICSGGFCGSTNTPCAVQGDCEFGACQTAATCVESCPGGFCPQVQAGWASGLQTSVAANTMLVCGFDGETSGELVTNRFANVRAGQLTEATRCNAVVGSGRCTCTAATEVADCGTGGDCDGANLCTVGLGDPLKSACTFWTNCNYATGRLCQVDEPDYLVTMIGHNDPIPWLNDVPVAFVYPFAQGRIASGHDPECEGKVSWDALYTGGQPIGHCPQFGASGYARPATACSRKTDCAGISTTSECLGRCITGSAANCSQSPTVHNLLCGNTLGDCSIDAPACDTSADCTRGRTCSKDLSGLPGILSGLCLCASDINCKAGYACVGDAGSKMCRKTCAVDGDCGPNTCDTTLCDASPGDGRCDASTVNVCRGRCTIPCNAVPCTRDGDCGGTTIASGNWGGLSSRFLRGKCNPASGTCACCGLVSCNERPTLSRRGCSCTTAGDCPSGSCINNECTGGARGDCSSDFDCPGQRCMRCDEAYRGFVQGHDGLLTKAAQKMQAGIDALNDSTPPVQVFSEIAATNGLLVQGGNLHDVSCVGIWHDKHYFSSSLDMLRAAGVLEHRLVRQTNFNAQRVLVPLLVDQVHQSFGGSVVQAASFASTLNSLNVCVQPGSTYPKTPQLYCQNRNASFVTRCTCDSADDCRAVGNGTCTSGFCTVGDATMVDCTTNGQCEGAFTCSPATCTTNGQCAPDETCNRRKCDQNSGACSPDDRTGVCCPGSADQCALD